MSIKSPAEIARQLAVQWHNADHREKRLLQAGAWPLRLPVGKPSATDFNQTALLREHIRNWQEVNIGEVLWERIRYRNASESVAVPLKWIIRSPSEWVDATRDKQVSSEYQQLSSIVRGVAPIFHKIVIRQRSLVIGKPASEIIQASELALQLVPHCAEGKPLRSLSLAGIDSKFFERHRQLVTLFLDLRFEGEASRQGLETFLDAARDKDHWLLVAELGEGLLPFRQQRVRSRELMDVILPADAILVVENERCLHQLPEVPNTIAVLGSGANLRWLSAEWLSRKNIAYWGDIDTWGLQLLARARLIRPDIKALLMEKEILLKFSDKAVAEPEVAGNRVPEGLTEKEADLYNYLLSCDKGRLEQEFIDERLVKRSILEWLKTSG